MPVPDGCDLREVLIAGHEVLRRYETLRTTFQETVDQLSQVVHAEGRFSVDLYETQEEHGWEFAAQVAEQLEARPFAAHVQATAGRASKPPSAVVDEWPVRFAVVLNSGRPAFLVVGFSHLVLDAGGAAVVAKEVARLLAGGAADRTPAWQPADLAAYEQSADGLAASERARDHWRQVLRSAPPTMFDLPARKPEKRRHICLQMESEAASQGALQLARRLHISTTGVILFAATAVVIGQYSGRAQAVLRLHCSNRTQEPQRTMAAHLARGVPCWLDFIGQSFDEIVRCAFEAIVSANLNSDYDPADVTAEIRAAELATGRHIDLRSSFNDLRVSPPVESGNSGQDLGDLMTRTAITEVEQLGERPLYVQVSPSGQIALQCDTAYVPRKSMSEMLRGIERLLVAGASRDLLAEELSAIADVNPAERGPGWIECRDGHIDLAATREEWQKVARSDLAEVYAEGHEPLPQRLVAYTVSHDEPIGTLHRKLVESFRKHKRTDVRAPDWYVRCGEGRRPPTDRDSWSSLPVLEEGSGRQS